VPFLFALPVLLVLFFQFGHQLLAHITGHSPANRLLGKTDLPRVVETRVLWEEAGQNSAEAAEEELNPLEEQPADEPPEEPVREEEPPC
jgi:hypothetical protein